MVTPLYPLPTKENNCTYVCHFFTREWVKMGYNVVVVHTQPIHCWMWHLAVRLFGKRLSNFFGGGNFYARKIKHTEHYVMDDVPVYRVPIYKFIPRGRYPAKSVAKLVNDVHKILNGLDFVPDVIVGHMTAIEIIPEINKKYHTKTCMVAHGVLNKIKERYPDWEAMIDSYDSWGFRAIPIKAAFEKKFKEVKKPFCCYSGIPERFLSNQNTHTFDKPLSRFLYIGDLIARKHPISLLQALPVCGGDYCIKYLGEGAERGQLEKYIKEHNLNKHVELVGRVNRDLVTNYLDEAECFIMISSGEAYGLVYLEAMARGCITVASRNEGFDGIIKDGENGFLCEAGNPEELKSIINKINALTPKERLEISEKGLKTARNMTDYLMAREYVENLEKI